jgi:transposase
MAEEIESIARRLVVGQKRDGRNVYDAAAKDALVRTCLEPGVSLAGIARRCGINANVLSHWVRLHERTRAKSSAACADVVEMPPSSFVPVQVQVPTAVASAEATVNLQLRLPNGVAVDLGDCELKQAVELIEAVGRMRCSASTKV